MQDKSGPVVLVHTVGVKELRGFAQLMADGKWSPRGSIIRHLDSKGVTNEVSLPLGEHSFETEQAAAEYGLNAAMVFSESMPI